MNNLRQIITVTALGMRTLHTRIKSSLVIVVGLACVVAVIFSLLSLEESLRLSYRDAGDPGRALLLSVGAQRERDSSLSRAAVNIIKDAPGIRKAADGSPMADAEILTKVSLTKKNHATAGTNLRGIGPTGFALRPELKLISGRMLRPGTDELIAGLTAEDKFIGLEVGARVALPTADTWSVVGIFSAGNLIDGDLIVDSQTLKATLRRPNYSTVLVRLDAPGSLAILKDALASNPTLRVNAERESDYWNEFFQSLPKTIIVVASVLGFIMGLGAVAGTLQTMYAVVSSRENEIAVLRAIGFGGFSVATSIVLEAMLLASIGAAIGTAIDWLWLNGHPYDFAYGVFRVTVDLHLLMMAMGFSLVIAFIGALSPAIKASRVTVVEALRAY